MTMSPVYNNDNKFKEKNDKLVPGPGQYEFHLRAMKTAPNWGFGSSKRKDLSKDLVTKDLITEPAGYTPATTFTKAASPNYRFGTQTRKMQDDKHTKFVPAPNSYKINRGAFDKRGILIAEKLN